jgi:hypothetical protein
MPLGTGSVSLEAQKLPDILGPREPAFRSQARYQAAPHQDRLLLATNVLNRLTFYTINSSNQLIITIISLGSERDRTILPGAC